MDDYPGGGSSSGTNHSRQDEDVRRQRPFGEGLMGISGCAAASR